MEFSKKAALVNPSEWALLACAAFLLTVAYTQISKPTVQSNLNVAKMEVLINTPESTADSSSSTAAMLAPISTTPIFTTPISTTPVSTTKYLQHRYLQQKQNQ